MGFLEVLTLIFVVCKLTSIVAWTWVQVFIPMYIAFAIYLFIFVGFLITILSTKKRF